jgi:hypothetical protein
MVSPCHTTILCKTYISKCRKGPSDRHIRGFAENAHTNFSTIPVKSSV